MYVKSPTTTFLLNIMKTNNLSWRYINGKLRRESPFCLLLLWNILLLPNMMCTRCCITDDGTKKNHHKKNNGLFFTYFFKQCYKSLLHMCICNYFFHKIPQRPLFGVPFKNFFKNLILAFSDYIVPITSTFSNLKRSDNVYKLFIQIIITQIYA